jgi:hypothetical protein
MAALLRLTTDRSSGVGTTRVVLLQDSASGLECRRPDVTSAAVGGGQRAAPRSAQRLSVRDSAVRRVVPDERNQTAEVPAVAADSSPRVHSSLAAQPERSSAPLSAVVAE